MSEENIQNTEDFEFVDSLKEIENQFKTESLGDRVRMLIRGLKAPSGSRESKEALIEKLATIHDGWIIHDLKNADRVVEQLDEEQKKLLDISLALATS